MRLGSSLGMITTAEGVETEEQLEILRAEGCMQVQGFLFSKAVPAAEIPLLLRRLYEAPRGVRRHSVRKVVPRPAHPIFRCIENSCLEISGAGGQTGPWRVPNGAARRHTGR
jgi:hypothetical protein